MANRIGCKALGLATACGLTMLALSPPALAQLDLARLTRGVQGDSRAPLSARALLPSGFRSGAAGRVPLIVRTPSGVAPSEPGFFAVGSAAVAELAAEDALALFEREPTWRFEWAPPRHILLDKVDGWIHGSEVRSALGVSGQGVVLGIVDTGMDLAHRDFQSAQGATRVKWLIDFSRPTQGLQPALESAYDCGNGLDTRVPCAIYSDADIDNLLAGSDPSLVPNDVVGHGSHVASLAGGNGLASATPKFIGVAPEATYVVARVARADDGLIQDTDLLRAVRFVFDRASELGMPAVVNLSLGSDFGAHDGSSALELGLAELVGPTHPGRAIVVAAGNSAGLYDGGIAGYPGPYGIHTEVGVARDSSSDVPLITPATEADRVTVSGTAFVWLEFRPGDDVSVAVLDQGQQLVPAVVRGDGKKAQRGELSVTVVNGDSGGSSELGANGAVVVLDGTWTTNDKFTLRLAGSGTAQLWVSSQGALGGTIGALFPRGEKQGTINVPASSPALIAVGASINRTSWTDLAGESVSFPKVGALDPAPLDSTAYFSSAGPNSQGVMKPDIVAPGVNVTGAMSVLADPRDVFNAKQQIFASLGRCEQHGFDSYCFVVDDSHAITSGTSMSAPIVSGAIALLFQRDASLTQDGVRALLQAGARPLEGAVLDAQQTGPGALDLRGAVAVQDALSSPVQRIPGAKSWLTLSASYAHPDRTWPVQGYLQLRDDAGQIADGFDPRRLRVEAELAVVIEPLTRVAPGLARFQVAAPAGSGGQSMRLRVLFDDRELASQTLPIGVDRWVVEDGVSARGGCALAERSPARSAPWLLFAAGLCLLRLRASRSRACMRAARTDRGPDHAGATRRRRPC